MNSGGAGVDGRGGGLVAQYGLTQLMAQKLR